MQDKVNADRQTEDGKYKAMEPLQTFIKETDKFRKEISEMDVKRDWMQLTIDELETALETLEDKKTDLDKTKKELISSIDDLER